MARKMIICTDIGGGDNDDQQSLVHALFYFNTIQIEGIIAGPDSGKRKVILEVLDAYEKDYPKFLAYDPSYPTPAYLRSISKQGALESPDTKGWNKPTAGSKRIMNVALKATDTVYVCCWGGVADVAQAIHNKPKIANKIFIYAIGTQNQEENDNAYKFVKKTKVPMISTPGGTYRGIFLTGMTGSGKYSNRGFVKEVIKPAGALGKYYYKISKDINVNKYGIKEGDTPSFLWVVDSIDADPLAASWGGSFRKVGSNRWEDRQEASLKIGKYFGAKTVAVHRQDILEDWENRIKGIYE